MRPASFICTCVCVYECTWHTATIKAPLKLNWSAPTLIHSTDYMKNLLHAWLSAYTYRRQKKKTVAKWCRYKRGLFCNDQIQLAEEGTCCPSSLACRNPWMPRSPATAPLLGADEWCPSHRIIILYASQCFNSYKTRCSQRFPIFERI